MTNLNSILFRMPRENISDFADPEDRRKDFRLMKELKLLIGHLGNGTMSSHPSVFLAISVIFRGLMRVENVSTTFSHVPSQPVWWLRIRRMKNGWKCVWIMISSLRVSGITSHLVHNSHGKGRNRMTRASLASSKNLWRNVSLRTYWTIEKNVNAEKPRYTM